MLVVECNGLYGNAYLGQLRRFSLPSENPWPLACLTDGYTSLWQYTTWHDSIATTGSYDIDMHRRSLPFVRRGYWPKGSSYYHACHQICRPDGVWSSHFAVCPTSVISGASEQTAKPDTLVQSASSFLPVQSGYCSRCISYKWKRQEAMPGPHSLENCTVSTGLLIRWQVQKAPWAAIHFSRTSTAWSGTASWL